MLACVPRLSALLLASETDPSSNTTLTVQGENQRPEVVIRLASELVEVSLSLGALDAVDLASQVTDVRPTHLAQLHVPLKSGCPPFLLGIGEDDTLDVRVVENALGILDELLTDTSLVDGDTTGLGLLDKRLKVLELFVVRILSVACEKNPLSAIIKVLDNRKDGLVTLLGEVYPDGDEPNGLVKIVPLLQHREVGVGAVDDEVPCEVSRCFVSERCFVLRLKPNKVATETVIDYVQLVSAVRQHPFLGAFDGCSEG